MLNNPIQIISNLFEFRACSIYICKTSNWYAMKRIAQLYKRPSGEYNLNMPMPKNICFPLYRDGLLWRSMFYFVLARESYSWKAEAMPEFVNYFDQ